MPVPREQRLAAYNAGLRAGALHALDGHPLRCPYSRSSRRRDWWLQGARNAAHVLGSVMEACR